MEEKLKSRVIKFFKDNNVECEETISQTDRVIENAYEFLEDLFNIVKDELDDEYSKQNQYKCPYCNQISTKEEINNIAIKVYGNGIDEDITHFEDIDYEDCYYTCPRCNEELEGHQWLKLN